MSTGDDDVRRAGAGAGTGTSAKVIRLRSIRTLVISRDLGFRQRAMTVLSDLGTTTFAVIGLDEPDDVHALVVRERADVVVLDVTVSAQAVANVLFTLYEHLPAVGVVAVSDRAATGHALAVLAKWGWAADLARAVQDAYRSGNPFKEDLSHACHQQP